MRINPSFIQCDCGHAVLVLNTEGHFTCPNPTCPNFEKIFKQIEVKAVPLKKSYREIVHTAAE